MSQPITSFDGGITIYVNTTEDPFRKQVSDEDAHAINNFFRVGHNPYVSYLRPPRLDQLSHLSGVVAFRPQDPGASIQFYPMSEAVGHYQKYDNLNVFVIVFFNSLDEGDVDFNLICKYFENVINGADDSWEPLEPILDYVRPVPISEAAPLVSEVSFGPKRLIITPEGVEDRTDIPLTEQEMQFLTQ